MQQSGSMLVNKNIFAHMPHGYLRIGTSDSPYSIGQMDVSREIHDIESFRHCYGFERNGYEYEGEIPDNYLIDSMG